MVCCACKCLNITANYVGDCDLTARPFRNSGADGPQSDEVLREFLKEVS